VGCTALVPGDAAVYAFEPVSEISQQTDEQLVDGARSGDRASLERLLERHERRVYRFGLKMCRDPEAAKDVLQETLIAAARTVKDFRGASSPSTWLYAIARSFCIKQRRRSKFAPEHEESIDSAATGREVLEIADPARSPDDLLSGRQIERSTRPSPSSIPCTGRFSCFATSRVSPRRRWRRPWA
jgi:RNA polymerase sigma factor (sigma-70 family)